MNGERKNELLMTVEELKNELRCEEMTCSKRESDISTIQNQTLVESRRKIRTETLISDQNRSVEVVLTSSYSDCQLKKKSFLFQS